MDDLILWTITVQYIPLVLVGALRLFNEMEGIKKIVIILKKKYTPFGKIKNDSSKQFIYISFTNLYCEKSIRTVF